MGVSDGTGLVSSSVTSMGLYKGVCVVVILKDDQPVPMGVDGLRDVMDHHSSNYIKGITALRLSYKPGTYTLALAFYKTEHMHLCTLWLSVGSNHMQHVRSRLRLKNSCTLNGVSLRSL